MACAAGGVEFDSVRLTIGIAPRREWPGSAAGRERTRSTQIADVRSGGTHLTILPRATATLCTFLPQWSPDVIVVNASRLRSSRMEYSAAAGLPPPAQGVKKDI